MIKQKWKLDININTRIQVCEVGLEFAAWDSIFGFLGLGLGQGFGLD